jgi:uncharacterized protein YjeT (DUF2065 family)
MSIPLLIEWFVAALLIVLGISHIAQPRLWVALFTDVLKWPYAALIIGAFTLPFGLLVAIGHNVWVLDVPVIVTIVGWGWTVKGTLYLIAPAVLHFAARPHVHRPNRFVMGGAIALVLGAVIMVRLVTLLRA